MGHPSSDSVGLLVYDGMRTIFRTSVLYYRNLGIAPILSRRGLTYICIYDFHIIKILVIVTKFMSHHFFKIHYIFNGIITETIHIIFVKIRV
jgi:hypothetical protein